MCEVRGAGETAHYSCVLFLTEREIVCEIVLIAEVSDIFCNCCIVQFFSTLWENQLVLNDSFKATAQQGLFCCFRCYLMPSSQQSGFKNEK